eukprot:3166468-Prymnesium_polylepis.1
MRNVAQVRSPYGKSEAGQRPCDKEGENGTCRPGEEEEATRGIATCGASVSTPGGRRLNASPKADHPAKGHDRLETVGAPRREAVCCTSARLGMSPRA